VKLGTIIICYATRTGKNSPLSGASLSEPHIDEFAVEFVYNIIIMYRTSCHKSLPALICEFLHGVAASESDRGAGLA